MKKVAVSLVVLLTVLGLCFSITSQIAQAKKGTELKPIVIATSDKGHYEVGEPVVITVTNLGPIDTMVTDWGGMDYATIKNLVTGEVVVDDGCPYSTLEMFHLKVGDSFSHTWDQTYNTWSLVFNSKTVGFEWKPDPHNGQQVPEGVYIVEWEHGDEWSAKAIFVIGYPKFVELASLS